MRRDKLVRLNEDQLKARLATLNSDGAKGDLNALGITDRQISQLVRLTRKEHWLNRINAMVTVSENIAQYAYKLLEKVQ